MPSRSIIVQLRAGVGQAILPDHRKMLPGVQYVIDWDTFQKISNGARQNVIQVVGVNSDTITASGSYVVAQTAGSSNTQLNIQQVLTTVSTTPITYNVAGFAAQGWNSTTNTGVTPAVSGSFTAQALNGPSGERYVYALNNTTTNISGSAVAVWADMNNGFITAARPTYQIVTDGQGTEYQISVNNTATNPVTIGTKQGNFAGVALVLIPSGNYGWIQTKGLAPSVLVSGVVNVGDTVAVGLQGAGKVQAPSASSALVNNVFGTALASGTNTTVAVDLRSLKAKPAYVRFLNKN